MKSEKSIDKRLYREAYERRKRHFDAELRARMRGDGGLAPEEAWRRVVELVEFCWKMAPRQSDAGRRAELVALAEYHNRLRKLEEWRRAHGKTP